MASRRGSLRNKSSDDVIRLLRSFGFTLARRASHDIYKGQRGGKERTVAVPRNKPTIAPKTLYAILVQAGISKDEAREFWA